MAIRPCSDCSSLTQKGAMGLLFNCVVSEKCPSSSFFHLLLVSTNLHSMDYYQFLWCHLHCPADSSSVCFGSCPSSDTTWIADGHIHIIGTHTCIVTTERFEKEREREREREREWERERDRDRERERERGREKESRPLDNGGFFLAFEDLGRMLDHSIPACGFSFLSGN